MKFGIINGLTAGAPISAIADIAIAAEERGFDSLWLPEHVVGFPEYESKYPYSESGKIPGGKFRGTMDPLMTLAWLAGLTKTIRLGTGICIISQRNPVYTARQVADVDLISGGRFDFGVGIGWLEEEFDVLHAPFKARGKLAPDYLNVMKALWCDDVAEYHGQHYDLPACSQAPQPVQKPHPPIIMGGNAEPALQRAAETSNGWFGFRLSPEETGAKIATLKSLVEKAGKNWDDFQISMTPSTSAVDEALVDQYRAVGVDQMILIPRGRTPEEMKTWMDGAKKLAA